MKKTALILAFAVASLPAAFGQDAGQSSPAPAPTPQTDKPSTPDEKGNPDTANRKKKGGDQKKDAPKSTPDSSNPNPSPNAPPPQR